MHAIQFVRPSFAPVGLKTVFDTNPPRTQENAISVRFTAISVNFSSPLDFWLLRLDFFHRPKPCQFPLKKQVNLAEPPVAVLGHDELGGGLLIIRGAGFIKSLAVNEHDEVAVLLEGAAFAQVGEPRSPRPPRFLRLPVELR